MGTNAHAALGEGGTCASMAPAATTPKEKCEPSEKKNGAQTAATTSALRAARWARKLQKGRQASPRAADLKFGHHRVRSEGNAASGGRKSLVGVDPTADVWNASATAAGAAKERTATSTLMKPGAEATSNAKALTEGAARATASYTLPRPATGMATDRGGNRKTTWARKLRDAGTKPGSRPNIPNDERHGKQHENPLPELEDEIKIGVPDKAVANDNQDRRPESVSLSLDEPEEEMPGAFRVQRIGSSGTFSVFDDQPLPMSQNTLVENKHNNSENEIIATVVDEEDPIVHGVATPMETTFKLFARDRRVRLCTVCVVFALVSLTLALVLVFLLTNSDESAPQEPSGATSDPTPVPTPSPVECLNLGVDVSCYAFDGQSCEEAINATSSRCDGRPTDIVTKFNGGNCNQSATSMAQQRFQCEDFDEGPPTEGLAYIKVTSLRSDTVYFEGPVIAGNDFHLNDNDLRVEADMIATISEGSLAGGRLLQTVTFQTSCKREKRNFHFGDVLGSLQVVGFTNGEREIVNRFFQATYRYTIKNQGESNVRLIQLLSTRNGKTMNLTDNVENIIVSSDVQEYSFEENELIDVTLPHSPVGMLMALPEQTDDCGIQKAGSAGASPSPSPSVFANYSNCESSQRCVIYFPTETAQPSLAPSTPPP